VIAWLARVISGVRGDWVNCVPPEGRVIFVANHTSHLDFILLWAALPRAVRLRTRPVAAKDYWEASPIRRYLSMNVFRAVLIDRTGGAGRHVLDPLLEALGKGDSLILFPEGTRGTGQMGEFQSGLYHLCLRCKGVEVRPVYLENLNRVLPKGEVLPVPLLMRVIYGAGFALEEGQRKPDFLEKARSSVEQLSRC
jgi:1-acyl-sn-glycerol-3-phosphate acyltransferase